LTPFLTSIRITYGISYRQQWLIYSCCCKVLLLQGFAACGKTLQQQNLLRTAAGSEDSRRKET